ncbi:MAG TPA: nucleotide exchange factor GrpE [Candidatus Onthovivens sp.]|nr:nucleotide exchange factor GrpE [Candidatus Onthovivens sp.]
MKKNDEVKDFVNEEENIEKNDTDKVEESKNEKKGDKIARLKTDVEYWKNEYYKAYADMKNLRKDVEKDHYEAIKYRLEGFVTDLLNVLDSFDIAFKYEAQNDEVKNYLKGFQFVHSNLINILENEGIQIINPTINTKFNENDMDAIEVIQDDGEENLVKEVQLKGYKLHDHLIRPAMVKVSKKEVENIKEA